MSGLGICGGDLIYIIESGPPDTPVVGFQATATQHALSTVPPQMASQPAPSGQATTSASPALATPPIETAVPSQDSNLVLVLTALSNYGFHLPADISAPALLAQGAVHSLEVYPTFAPSTVVHVKLVAMGGQLCIHARWRQGGVQGHVLSLVLPCLDNTSSNEVLTARRRKLQVWLGNTNNMSLLPTSHLGFELGPSRPPLVAAAPGTFTAA